MGVPEILDSEGDEIEFEEGFVDPDEEILIEEEDYDEAEEEEDYDSADEENDDEDEEEKQAGDEYGHRRLAQRRTIKGELKQSTPAWYQTKRDSGHPVGCGATAWAVVYGYWKQYKGKSNLLDGISMPHRQTGQNDPDLRAAMEEIAKDMDTKYFSYKGKKYGRTDPWNMEKGKRYGERRGYSVSVKRIRGTEFSKVGKVIPHIRDDKPAFILINDPKKPISTLHYVVIEKANKTQKKVWGKWRNRGVFYYVNFDWMSGLRRDIWVRMVGINPHKRWGSFSIFLIDIT